MRDLVRVQRFLLNEGTSSISICEEGPKSYDYVIIELSLAGNPTVRIEKDRGTARRILSNLQVAIATFCSASDAVEI